MSEFAASDALTDNEDSSNPKRRPAEMAWGRLQGERENYLLRAREVSSLTLPFLIPPDGTTDSTVLPTPYQGTGAEGINNLASKFILTLFPPSANFFRMIPDPAVVRELGEEQGADPDEIESKVNEDISIMEQEAHTEYESRSLRPILFTASRHLIAAGNYLLRKEKDGVLRGFSLPNFVIQRDGVGTILWVVTREEMSVNKLPEGVTAPEGAKSVMLFTAAERIGSEGNYRVWHEIEGRIFNGDTVDEDHFPYIAPVMFDLDGHSYGRGLGEHYLGDLISLEALSRAIVLSSTAAAHLVWLVNPNGFTKVSDLQNARTGQYIPGLPSDVQSLKLDKNADLTITANTAERIERKLNRAFLLNLGAQRDAERVTAEEIRLTAQQIEATHGGTQSLLSGHLQLPIAKWIIQDMTESGKLPVLDPSFIAVKIVTGLEGLGRSAELDRLRTFWSVATETFGPDAVGSRTNLGNALSRIAAATGVNTVGLLKTDEDLQAEQQAAQQAAIAQSVAGPIAGAATGPLIDAVSQQQAPPQ